MSKGYFVALMSLGLVLASCGPSKKEVQLAEEAELDSIMSEAPDTLELFEEVAPPKAVDELFDDFFFTFASDARFQNQRIRFPLRFKDEDAEMRLTKDDWHTYNRFRQQEFFSVIYEHEEDLALQKDTAVQEVNVQWIYLHDGYVENYHFKRIPEGMWVLFDIEKQEVDSTANGGFVRFYADFVTDSAYQRACLSDPLPVHVTHDDETEAEDNEITPDEWYEMKSDLPIPNDVLVNINYGQRYTGSAYKNVLMEGASNGLFLNFRFEREGVDWRLVRIEM